MDYEKHLVTAQTLYNECQKKLLKYDKSYFKVSSDKYYDLADDFVKAAKNFQIGKNPGESANAYVFAAKCYSKSSIGTIKAGNSYISAGGALAEKDPSSAAALYIQGLKYLTEEGKFGMAAKYQAELAEMFERMGDLPNAIQNFETAADYFEMEKSLHSAAANILRCAHLSADIQKWKESAVYFERAVEMNMSGSGQAAMKHVVKDYYLKAGIVLLRMRDVVAAEKLDERARKRLPEFWGTREEQILLELIAAVKENNEEKVGEIAGEWERVGRYEEWHGRIIDGIRQSMEEEDDDLT